MKHIQWKRARHVHWCTLLGVLLILVALPNTRVFTQSLSEWTIPGTPNIQGLDALYPENPYNYVFFTEYPSGPPVGRIGMLNNINLTGFPGGTAFLSEWFPVGINSFHPFKIVAGRWNFYARANPTLVTTTVPPYFNPPNDVSPKDILKYIQFGFRISPTATFTMPDDNKIGMLIPSPYPAGADYYWIWGPTGNLVPWDIQRRSIGSDEVSAWISNRTTEAALYQFFPFSNTLARWDLNLTQCASTSGTSSPIGALKVEVYYVVPAPNAKSVTEIWIGGTHPVSTVGAAPHDTDCIAYMVVNKSNTAAAVTVWDIPGSNLRTMTSIVFTHQPNKKTGFTNAQAWLTSSSEPELTILQPGTKTTSGSATDKICVVDSGFNAPNGTFWDDPSYTATLQAIDNNRRIWITSEGATGPAPLPGFLSANKAQVTDVVTRAVCSSKAVPQTIDFIRIRAERKDQDLFDSTGVTKRNDVLECTDRYIWDPTTGFNANFTGALLDINMQGKADAQVAANAFNYTIIWHEPTTGRIGMLWDMTAPLPVPLFSNGYKTSLLDEQPAEFRLEQNYPNPFNPSTTIDYVLPADSRVSLKIYNSLGQEVAVLLNNEVQSSGEQSVTFNPSNLASGVYFYRIITQGIGQDASVTKMDVKKMLFLK